jgi:hypothetical protein
MFALKLGCFLNIGSRRHRDAVSKRCPNGCGDGILLPALDDFAMHGRRNYECAVESPEKIEVESNAM